MQVGMKIQKVPSEVQSALRNGISISNVTHCISELVQNSLDAEATSIAVRVNLDTFTLQVVDNGHGLTKEELDIVGQRYMTSKCHSIKDLKRNLSYYGFRGESLANIRESCRVLMIISKTKGCEQTYSKVFRAGKRSHEAVVTAHDRLCIGTTIVVKDFLHNLPVRRARIQPTIEIEYIKHCLISLSIINYEILGQVDKKFIAAILRPREEINMILVLFDQHAVDERIRLESLISGYKKSYGELQSHTLSFDLELNLSEAEISLVKDLFTKLSKLGLDFVIQENKLKVTKIPLCLFNRFTREGEKYEWLKNMVTGLIKYLVLAVQDNHGVMPTIPPLLSELISMEACRGSIKFGDVLTMDLCRTLISKLANCEMPFQCAHGRPVLAPLIEMENIEDEVESVNLKKLYEMIQSH